VVVDIAKILSVVDLTSLNETDDESVIDALCINAISVKGHVAAVCVYPRFVKQAVKMLTGNPVKIATVANFPHGNESIVQVMQSIHDSIQNGAQEIDVVFPYSRYLSGDKDGAFQLIHQCKQVCGESVLLKVILETGALNDERVIADVSCGVLNAGADFLKTSTGKISVGATIEAARSMLQVIKEMTPKLNRSLGFKASGGIRTLKQAEEYMQLASQIMNPEWVTAKHFRLGMSKLLT
jgi:deoxyribose-phosphate aldolase